jgi:CarD family transcriptional regulator
MNPFAIGNLAVYHGKGVGLITGLSTTDPKGNPCLICNLELKKSVAQVRVDHPSQTTVRTIMNSSELEDVYSILRTQDIRPNTTTWNRRYRGYIQNINSGIPKEIAEVLRDLELLGIKKSLSFGESKIYSDAKELIVEEGAYTLMMPILEEFLHPFTNVKAHALLQNLNALLQKLLKDGGFEFSNKGMKDISNLKLELPDALPDDENKFVHIFNILVENLHSIEEEANKIIMRAARKALNSEHKPYKEKPESTESCFAILVPWRNISMVGIIEKRELSGHKSYESLKNLFIEKGCEGLEDFDLESIVKPMVEFANHHIMLQLRDIIGSLDLKLERKRKSRAKPKPVVRKSQRSTEPELEAPKALQSAIKEIEQKIKDYKVDLNKVDSFDELQTRVYDCFIDLDTMMRLESLETIQVYLDENIEQYRVIINNQLDAIFADARKKGEKEKEEKAKKTKPSKKGDEDSDSSN